MVAYTNTQNYSITRLFNSLDVCLSVVFGSAVDGFFDTVVGVGVVHEFVESQHVEQHSCSLEGL